MRDLCHGRACIFRWSRAEDWRYFKAIVRRSFSSADEYEAARLASNDDACERTRMPTQDQIIIAAARSAYGAVSATREAFGETMRPSWESLPPMTRAQLVEAARLVLLRGASPRGLHEQWLKDRLATGWTYGDTEDRVNRFHPAMLPWDDLPAEQRAKGHAFALVARAVGNVLGLVHDARNNAP